MTLSRSSPGAGPYGRLPAIGLKCRWPILGPSLAPAHCRSLFSGRPRYRAVPRVDLASFSCASGPRRHRLERNRAFRAHFDHAIFWFPRRVERKVSSRSRLPYVGNPPWSYPVQCHLRGDPRGRQEAVLLVRATPGQLPLVDHDRGVHFARYLCGALPVRCVSLSQAGDIVAPVLNFGAPTPISLSVAGANIAETLFAQKIVGALAHCCRRCA